MKKLLVIDLFCGLGGWAEGFLYEGYDVIGFDIESWPYPGQLVLQDVQSLHGSQFKSATVIVASPPCQAYSYRAMPWKRAKMLEPPDNNLFNECFRIQREASEAVGHHIPMIVENVKGAQKWVGRAKWHYGSYYLWSDVPALMPHNRFDGVKLPRNNGPRQSDERVFKRLGSGWRAFSSTSSSSSRRKQASALIAKIPFPLANHIAKVFKSKDRLGLKK